MRASLGSFARDLFHRLPERDQARMRRLVHPVRWGGFRRFEPFDPNWGYGRGTPVDRWYIDSFVEGHAQDMRGRVLEVASPMYVGRHMNDVARVDILDVDPANPEATIIADIGAVNSLPAAAFDCIIFTQTLQYAHDIDTALVNLWQALVPGGVLLMSAPATSKGCAYPHAADYWRFLPAGLLVALQRTCPAPECEVVGFGNLPVALGFLLGLAAEELRTEELARRDSDFTIVTCARVRKPHDT